MANPVIIQGGMGVAVSGWQLARAVSRLNQLGVVSGTALAVVLARRLQAGDPGGDVRMAMEHFPLPEVSQRVLRLYYIPGGKAADAKFKLTHMPNLQPSPALVELTVLANFVEVFLAKHGHSGVVGINFLEKIQLPTLPSIFGAMLANVDYVLMGAGIPRAIPGVIDALSRGEAVRLRIDVEGALAGEEHYNAFDPAAFFGGTAPVLKRPLFLGIVSSATLAMTLAKKASGKVDGFVVENYTAGGHNAPPRGPMQLSAQGEPVYGPRDNPELDKIRALGLPFWLAGGFGRKGRLPEALSLGAAGIQVGTPFAYCAESGIDPELKAQVLEMGRRMQSRVFTDPLASPTGFPFKVVQLERTLSEASVYQERERICDLGYLRHLYRRPDGSIGYRCPAEPIENFLLKGGTMEETVGRKCVCNGLPATVSLGQARGASEEPPLVTAGDYLNEITEYLQPGADSYSAADVVQQLLESATTAVEPPATELAPPAGSIR
jgi:NAD(P)H-dependent flavin oxidoreductase YrpB (nitropropane dioxygenase family)